MPLFDSAGKQKEFGIKLAQHLADHVVIPWKQTFCRPYTTKRQMLDHRLKQSLPDPSFDIDGDGLVSHKDLFLASKFDRDQDGRLSATEKQLALEAMQAGFENNFVFGLERAGLNEDIRNSKHALKHIRIIQKSGKVIQGEDFTVLAPEREAAPSGRPATRQELARERKQTLVSQLQSQYDKAQLSTKQQFVTETHKTAESQQKRFSSQKDRQNYDSYFGDATCKVSHNPAPSLNYVEVPVFATKTQMSATKFKQEQSLLQQRTQLESNKRKQSEISRDAEERIRIDESCDNSNTMTLTKLKELRKLKTKVQQPLNTKYGIHASALPQFYSGQAQVQNWSESLSLTKKLDTKSGIRFADSPKVINSDYQTNRKIKVVKRDCSVLTDKPTNQTASVLVRPASMVERRNTEAKFTEAEGPTFIKTKRLFDLICESGNQYQKGTFGFRKSTVQVKAAAADMIAKPEQQQQPAKKTPVIETEYKQTNFERLSLFVRCKSVLRASSVSQPTASQTASSAASIKQESVTLSRARCLTAAGVRTSAFVD